jgi:hypothetical protein
MRTIRETQTELYSLLTMCNEINKEVNALAGQDCYVMFDNYLGGYERPIDLFNGVKDQKLADKCVEFITKLDRKLADKCVEFITKLDRQFSDHQDIVYGLLSEDYSLEHAEQLVEDLI